MKTFIIFFISAIVLAQNQNIDLNFGGRGCRQVSSAACSIEPSISDMNSAYSKETSSPQLKKLNEYSVELWIPISYLNIDEKKYLCGNEPCSFKDPHTMEFEFAETVSLDNATIKALETSPLYNLIMRGKYPMKRVDDQLIITILLQRP